MLGVSERIRKSAAYIAAALLGATGVYAALHFYSPPAMNIPTARVERRDFLNTVRTRGEIKSAQSVFISAPQTPDLRIVQLTESGKQVSKGDIVVAFDTSTQEDLQLQRVTELRAAESEMVQAQAQHAIANEDNAMAIMQAQYNVERAELEASKQEILSEIEGAKNRITVGVTKGELSGAKTNAEAAEISQQADMSRISEKKQKAVRDLETTKNYLGSMVLRAPANGIVQILPNTRSGSGGFRANQPPFQEGDTVWTGAAIAEIPDLTSLRVEFRIEEIDRGRVALRQPVRIRVDAVPDAQLSGKVESLSPVATLVFRRFPPEKNFPAQASLDKIDPRLRPGMSATAEVIVERSPDVLVIPSKASFQIDGQPTVFVQKGAAFERRRITIGARNSAELLVAEGLQEGEVVALENPELNEKDGKL
jgi:multidrug resistance efflux pump